MNNHSNCTNRLVREYKEILNDPPHNISVGLKTDKQNNENLRKWEATILGPTDTPYSSGIFRLNVDVPDDYPFKPPNIKFATRIFHPNIDSQGNICLDILKHAWSPALTISNVLLSICTLLGDPNPDDPLDTEAARLYNEDRQKYNKTVREFVQKYA